ncbi:MAG: hypothetical protein J3R72DRAFT_530181 [Linnemannia gamsii]|nr:MAG: hypothetical protein J3R72DRAFT_530181 [Linnemannia gamsii]
MSPCPSFLSVPFSILVLTCSVYSFYCFSSPSLATTTATALAPSLLTQLPISLPCQTRPQAPKRPLKLCCHTRGLQLLSLPPQAHPYTALPFSVNVPSSAPIPYSSALRQNLVNTHGATPSPLVAKKVSFSIPPSSQRAGPQGLQDPLHALLSAARIPSLVDASSSAHRQNFVNTRCATAPSSGPKTSSSASSSFRPADPLYVLLGAARSSSRDKELVNTVPSLPDTAVRQQQLPPVSLRTRGVAHSMLNNTTTVPLPHPPAAPRKAQRYVQLDLSDKPCWETQLYTPPENHGPELPPLVPDDHLYPYLRAEIQERFTQQFMERPKHCVSQGAFQNIPQEHLLEGLRITHTEQHHPKDANKQTLNELQQLEAAVEKTDNRKPQLRQSKRMHQTSQGNSDDDNAMQVDSLQTEAYAQKQREAEARTLMATLRRIEEDEIRPGANLEMTNKGVRLKNALPQREAHACRLWEAQDLREASEHALEKALQRNMTEQAERSQQQLQDVNMSDISISAIEFNHQHNIHCLLQQHHAAPSDVSSSSDQLHVFVNPNDQSCENENAKEFPMTAFEQNPDMVHELFLQEQQEFEQQQQLHQQPRQSQQEQRPPESFSFQLNLNHMPLQPPRPNHTIPAVGAQLPSTTATNSIQGIEKPKMVKRRVSDKRLLRIFAFLKMERGSLRQLLLESFVSKNSMIRKLIGHFYGKGGPAAVLRHWRDSLRRIKRFDRTLTNAVIDFAVDRLRLEIKRLTKDISVESSNSDINTKPITEKNGYSNSNSNSNNNGSPTNSNSGPCSGSNDEWAQDTSTSTSNGDVYDEGDGEESDDEDEVEESNEDWSTETLDYDVGDDEETEQVDIVEPNKDHGASLPFSIRMSANKMTQAKVMAFSFDTLHCRVETGAPGLTRLLHGLIRKPHRPASNTTAATDEQKPKKLVEQEQTMVGTISGMLIHCRSQKANYFQRMMGIYLHATGCLKRVVEMLAKAHFCTSYDATLSAVKSLTQDALALVRKFVQERDWFLVYDNINIFNKKADQRGNNTDTMENGTTATVIGGIGLGDNGDDRKPDKPLARLTIDDFKYDNEHRKKVLLHFIFSVLQRRHPACPSITVPPVSEIKKLIVEKSIHFPLPAMKIEQSSVEGYLEILHTVMQISLQLSPEYFNGKYILVAGDNLTVVRINSIQTLMKSENTAYNRMQWAIPVVQLFHLRMNLCSLILRTHYGALGTPGSLASDIAMLRRKSKFDALVMCLWDEKLEARLEAVDESMLPRIVEAAEYHCAELSQPSQEYSKQRGTANTNAILFIRDMLVYLELTAAIKCGVVGRIVEVLKTVTIMFQVTSTKNYGNQLLRFAYDIRHTWSDVRKDAIFQSWLVNVSGKSGSNRSWEYLELSTSMNVRLYGEIQEKVEGEFGVTFNSNHHSTVSTKEDVSRIMASLKNMNIFKGSNRTIDEVRNVCDLQETGMERLNEEGLYAFHEILKARHITAQGTAVVNSVQGTDGGISENGKGKGCSIEDGVLDETLKQYLQNFAKCCLRSFDPNNDDPSDEGANVDEAPILDDREVWTESFTK